MNRASSATGWVRNPIMKSPDLDPTQASSYELGWTYNPITGCLNHIDGLCKGGGFPCYAYKLANGRLRQRYLANKNVAPRRIMTHDIGGQHYEWEDDTPDIDPFYPRFWAENSPSCRLYDPAFRQKPAGIFVCDMGELFGDWLPQGWQEDIFDIIEDSPQHRFYLLTKQPQNLIKWSPFPDNCWVGVTATNRQGWIDAQRELDFIKATIKYVSCEPLLEHLPISPYDFRPLGGSIDWVIIGAQTKPYKPPQIEWIEEIARACDKAGVPVFLKDNLKPLLDKNFRPCCYSHRNLYGWELRQELPK